MNRRLFFKNLSIALLLPAALISYFSVKRQKHILADNQIIIPEKELKDQAFYQGIFIRIKENEVVFYSNKCSHLGCQINQIKDNQLLCPCHGSTYDLNGKVINGPAKKDLLSLNFDYLASEKSYLIYKNT